MNYPPPTLVPRRSRASWARRAVFVVTLGLLLGTCTLSRYMRDDSVKPDADPIDDAPQMMPAGNLPSRAIDSAPPPAPVAAAVPVPATAGVQADTIAPVEPSPDGRKPGHWYYVPQIGDGPGAIYSRTGGGWDYAFACTLATRTIEFIAVNTGDPGSFDQQYLRVGRAKLMMDASYSKDAHGTISTKLPAKHPFFDAFVGADKSLELQLLADRKLVLPVGSEVTRLIRECRGSDEPKPAGKG